ncbi:MAG: LacI family DNA-binding transcriptional regulator [Clostridia bacterium]|nr:LacI family DNA-binding transcriptional regulator [Clostridia bacterium]
MTLTRIAKEAGVSVSTVSKALNESKEISSKTSEKIKKIALKQGYFDKKRKLKKEYNKSDNFKVAVFCPEIISVYYSSVVTCLCKKLEEAGGKGFVHITNFNSEKELRSIEQLTCDLGMSAVISFDNTDYGKDFNLPVLKLCPSNKYDNVYSDISQGIDSAVLFLKNSGHKRIGYIGEELTATKFNYLKNALKNHELEINPDYFYKSSARFEEAGRQGANYLAKNLPDAIICAYDEIAIGAIAEFKKLGIRVPEDISVIGINDIPFSPYATTPLTSLRSDIEELCSIGIRLLKNKVDNPGYNVVQSIAIKYKLILRETHKEIKNNG